jgi:4-carboxymuconolactone decarboxylase
MNQQDSSLMSRATQAGFSPLVGAGALALAATVDGREELAESIYRQAFAIGVPAETLAEVARMAHLFGGFPRAIQGLHAFARAAGDASSPPLAGEGPPEPDRASDRGRGLALFRKIYESQSDEVLRGLSDVLPGFETWILEHAYGRVLSRPALGARERELMAVSALAVLRCPAQLASHARGALRLGAPAGEVRGAVRILEGLFDRTALAEAAAVLRPLLDYA